MKNIFRIIKTSWPFIEENTGNLPNKLKVETEPNGMYKLIDDGFIMAPFGELNVSCWYTSKLI
jgi:hypothetical protein